jgi:Protein of unknown function (DUF3551)
MRDIQIGLFLATIVLPLMASATPSAAVIIYPWCAVYMGPYTTSCGSTSLKQCLATRAGNGGTCEPNPYYQPYPPPPTYSPPITRRGPHQIAISPSSGMTSKFELVKTLISCITQRLSRLTTNRAASARL